MSDDTSGIYKSIIAVTNRSLCDHPFSEQIERVCRVHPQNIILREKDLDDTEYERLALNVSDICKMYNVPLTLHMHEHAALKIGARRIHFSMSGLRSSDNILRFETVGASVHSEEEAIEAEKLGASYITAGHIYATDCKMGMEPRGLDFLKRICRSVKIPVYAIGGIKINSKQIEEVVSCGAAGACVMSAMMTL